MAAMEQADRNRLEPGGSSPDRHGHKSYVCKRGKHEVYDRLLTGTQADFR